MLNRKMEIVMKKFVLTSILAMFVTTQYSAEAGLFGIGTNKAVADYFGVTVDALITDEQTA